MFFFEKPCLHQTSSRLSQSDTRTGIRAGGATSVVFQTDESDAQRPPRLPPSLSCANIVRTLVLAMAPDPAANFPRLSCARRALRKARCSPGAGCSCRALGKRHWAVMIDARGMHGMHQVDGKEDPGHSQQLGVSDKPAGGFWAFPG